MPGADGKLTEEELKKRWKTPEGEKFRNLILLQLQDPKRKHKVNWEKLNVNIGGKDYRWKLFEGVEEFSKPKVSKIKNGIVWYDQPIMYATFIQRKNYHGIKYLNSDNKRYGDLRGIDFHGFQLKNAQLDLVCLEDADLTKSDFEGTNFEQANLKDSDLSGSHLKAANFSGANLTNYRGQNTNFVNVKVQLKSWWYRVTSFLKDSKSSIFIDQFFIPMTLILSPLLIISSLFFLF